VARYFDISYTLWYEECYNIALVSKLHLSVATNLTDINEARDVTEDIMFDW
jgi:hypothetical protein